MAIGLHLSIPLVDNGKHVVSRHMSTLLMMICIAHGVESMVINEVDAHISSLLELP